jgi:mxaJ protein
MFFRYLSVFLVSLAPWPSMGQNELRVCADPNNMPFSNQQEEGFENKLAELIASKLRMTLQYTWWSQRKSFIKNSLEERRCDVLMGIPASMNSVDVTRPYYRSTYVFVSRHDRNLHINSLDDPRLTELRIGIHVVGDDYAPPAYALARRGAVRNLVSFSLFGEYGEQNPPGRIVDAVARGAIDVAIVWGPFAGYFSRSENTPLDIAPVSPAVFLGVPFTYEISMGVRKGNEPLRSELDAVLTEESAAVERILSQYGVPRVR